MKWLLWTQLALVLASLSIGIVAMMTIRYGMAMVVATMWGLLPILLIAGVVMGLVALKRRKGHIHAGIVLLAPAALILATAFPETSEYEYEGQQGYVPLEFADELAEMEAATAETVQWMNWVWWSLSAAAVLAVASALLLFRRKES